MSSALTRSEKAKLKRNQGKTRSENSLTLDQAKPLETVQVDLPPDIVTLVNQAIQVDDQKLSDAAYETLQQQDQLLTLYVDSVKAIQQQKWEIQAEKDKALMDLALRLNEQLAGFHGTSKADFVSYTNDRNAGIQKAVDDILEFLNGGLEDSPNE